MLISVIIPMYNAAATIERCIQSVAEQSYKDLEIIIIDDGSTDNSAQIVKEFSKADERVHYYKKPNGGVSSARNMGIRQSSGEYLCFVDSDDAVQKEYVTALLEEMMRASADITLCGFRDIRPDRQTDHLLSEEQLSKLQGTLPSDLFLLREFINSPCMKLYAADIIREHGLLFREDMVTAEDQYFNYQYYGYCHTVAFVNQPNYLYYTADSTLSVRRTEKCFENELEKLAFAKSFMERYEVENGMQIVGRDVCYAVRRYIFLSKGRNSLRACCERLKRIREIHHQPMHLVKWQDQLIYQLLLRRFYAVLCAYLWCRLKLPM